MRLHHEDAALADFDAALKLEPRNLLALIGRAEADYASKRFVASLDEFNHIIELDPRNATAYFRRGNIRLDRHDWAAALSDYSASLELDPDQPVALYNRSIAEARLGRRKEAAADQRRSLALHSATTATAAEASLETTTLAPAITIDTPDVTTARPRGPDQTPH